MSLFEVGEKIIATKSFNGGLVQNGVYTVAGFYEFMDEKWLFFNELDLPYPPYFFKPLFKLNYREII